MDKRIQVRLVAARMLRLVIAVILSVLSGWAFNANAQTLTYLCSIGPILSDEFLYPSGLLQGSDGNFYGTTYSGREDVCGCGTVFRVSPGGSYTNLYTFASYPFSMYPNEPNIGGGLAQGSDGNFYGTTPAGGTNSCNCGTVFRISPSGNYTSLYSFGSQTNDGWRPLAQLVQGSDGNFYGTTAQGGTNYTEEEGAGTVFRISPSGNYTNLYSFGSFPTDGFKPVAGLVQGSDENFYGTTYYGGTSNAGTLFQISSSGTYTILYSLMGPPTDGEGPVGRLAQGSDGNFYGTTKYGGTNSCDCGTVFRISPSGTSTTLHWFAGYPSDGANPEAGLVQGSDGNFYGTAVGGGQASGGGTVFRISPNGSYTNLYLFGAYPEGEDPATGLVQGSDGNFYGTTQNGGTYSGGTVFKLTVPLSPPANQISEIQFFNVFDSTIVALSIPSVARETYQLQYTASMSPTNWLNTGGTITSIGGPLVLIDLAEPLPPQRFYRAVITP